MEGLPDIQSYNQAELQKMSSREFSAARRASIGGAIGYQSTDVGEEYVVQIIDWRPRLAGERERVGVKKRVKSQMEPIIIRALLQEKFEMTTEAKWHPLSIATIIQSFPAEMAAIVGKSPVNRWSSRRHWDGTTPMAFTLNLKFAAEMDAEREVLMPIKELQRMVLPYVGEGETGNFFLSAPGPNIYQWSSGNSWKNKTNIITNQETPAGIGEVIDVKIGKLLYIRRAIVSKVTVGIHPVFEMGGLPLVATAAVTFETFEIMTKNALDSEIYNPLRTVVSKYSDSGVYISKL